MGTAIGHQVLSKVFCMAVHIICVVIVSASFSSGSWRAAVFGFCAQNIIKCFASCFGCRGICHNMGGWGKSPRKRVAEPVDNVLSSNKFYFYAKKLWGEAKTVNFMLIFKIYSYSYKNLFFLIKFSFKYMTFGRKK